MIRRKLLQILDEILKLLSEVSGMNRVFWTKNGRNFENRKLKDFAPI